MGLKVERGEAEDGMGWGRRWNGVGPKVEWGGTECGMGLTESGVRWHKQDGEHVAHAD